MPQYPWLKGVDIRENPPRSPMRFSNELCFDVGTIGGGGNSGFQALNLALHWGCKRILLVGFDMIDRNGVHWYGRNDWARGYNPGHSNFRLWISVLEKCKPEILRRAEVYNANKGSAVKSFPYMSVRDFIS